MDSNHRPSASQTDALYRLSYTSMAEKRRFELPQDCSRHLSGVLPYQLGDFSKWKRVEESNPRAFNPFTVFRTVYPHGCYPPKDLRLSIVDLDRRPQLFLTAKPQRRQDAKSKSKKCSRLVCLWALTV